MYHKKYPTCFYVNPYQSISMILGVDEEMEKFWSKVWRLLWIMVRSLRNVSIAHYVSHWIISRQNAMNGGNHWYFWPKATRWSFSNSERSCREYCGRKTSWLRVIGICWQISGIQSPDTSSPAKSGRLRVAYFFDLFSSFHILSSWLIWSTPSRLRLSLHSDRLFVVKSSKHYKPLRTFGEVLFFITFNSMFRYVTIITKKILLSERIFWWWIISKNQIRSKMSGFFLTKIYGTAFQMIVFEKPPS